MADFLNEFVKVTMEDEIKTNYPHIKSPSIVYAKVTEMKQAGDIRLVTLRILTVEWKVDENYPLFPFVKTEHELLLNDFVVVGFPYGGNVPYILGRCLE